MHGPTEGLADHRFHIRSDRRAVREARALGNFVHHQIGRGYAFDGVQLSDQAYQVARLRWTWDLQRPRFRHAALSRVPVPQLGGARDGLMLKGAPEAQQRLGHRRRCFLRRAALARPGRLCSGQFPHWSDPEWCRHVANSNLISSITSPDPISRKSPMAVTPSWRNGSTDHGRRTRPAWSAGLLLVCGNHHVQRVAGLVLSVLTMSILLGPRASRLGFR